MRIRLTLSALLAAMAALLLAFATPALAKGGTGGGGGGGGGTTTVPAVSCAQIVSAVVNPNPLPINPNPVFPEPIVVQLGAPVGPAVAFDVTVNNQCADEVAAGPKGSLAVAMTTFDTATGARLFTGVNMQPAFALMTWRHWGPIPATDTAVPAHTEVISVTKANGQVQDTLTYTAAALNQAILTAEATGLPQSLR